MKKKTYINLSRLFNLKKRKKKNHKKNDRKNDSYQYLILLV